MRHTYGTLGGKLDFDEPVPEVVLPLGLHPSSLQSHQPEEAMRADSECHGTGDKIQCIQLCSEFFLEKTKCFITKLGTLSCNTNYL